MMMIVFNIIIFYQIFFIIITFLFTVNCIIQYHHNQYKTAFFACILLFTKSAAFLRVARYLYTRHLLSHYIAFKWFPEWITKRSFISLFILIIFYSVFYLYMLVNLFFILILFSNNVFSIIIINICFTIIINTIRKYLNNASYKCSYYYSKSQKLTARLSCFYIILKLSFNKNSSSTSISYHRTPFIAPMSMYIFSLYHVRLLRWLTQLLIVRIGVQPWLKQAQ